MDFNTQEDFLIQVRKLAVDSNMTKSSTDGFVGIFQKILNQDSLDDQIAKRIGQFFYYYSQIDEVLTTILKSLLPELDIKVIGLDSSRDGNSFKRKTDLIKSLIPNSNQLKIFPLLDKINSIRNKLAHRSPKQIDFKKINQELETANRDAFCLKTYNELLYSTIGSENESDDVTNLVKNLYYSKLYIELFADIEVLGKSEDTSLKFFETIRKFSSLYVRRRFSILAYQIQTETKSADAPEAFKMTSEFNMIIEELKTPFKNFIKVLFSGKMSD